MPTCILLPDDFAALGGLSELEENGFRVPEDISVIGYDGLVSSKVLGLTTWEQNSDMLGKKAAEKLIEIIEDSEAIRTGSLTVEGKLIKGTSLGVVLE